MLGQRLPYVLLAGKGKQDESSEGPLTAAKARLAGCVLTGNVGIQWAVPSDRQRPTVCGMLTLSLCLCSQVGEVGDYQLYRAIFWLLITTAFLKQHWSCVLILFTGGGGGRLPAVLEEQDEDAHT